MVLHHQLQAQALLGQEAVAAAVVITAQAELLEQAVQVAVEMELLLEELELWQLARLVQ
jgi:hypothetical protein